MIALPNGSRFVFWRGAAYTPFWAGNHNTALNFEFAEPPRRPDGLDCIDAASDKELRRSRVEIVESTPARVHGRWTAQPCDLNSKVWGETATDGWDRPYDSVDHENPRPVPSVRSTRGTPAACTSRPTTRRCSSTSARPSRPISIFSRSARHSLAGAF